MFGFLRNWIATVVTGSVLISLALAITPEGGVKKALRLASGLIMTIILLTPFTRSIPKVDINNPGDQNIYAQDNSEVLKEIIEEEVAAYIVNKAQAVGLTIIADVSCDDGEPYPMPASVVVFSEDPEMAKRELESILQSDLGIKPENQHYGAVQE